MLVELTEQEIKSVLFLTAERMWRAQLAQSAASVPHHEALIYAEELKRCAGIILKLEHAAPAPND